MVIAFFRVKKSLNH